MDQRDVESGAPAPPQRLDWQQLAHGAIVIAVTRDGPYIARVSRQTHHEDGIITLALTIAANSATLASSAWTATCKQGAWGYGVYACPEALAVAAVWDDRPPDVALAWPLSSTVRRQARSGRRSAGHGSDRLRGRS